VEKARLFLQHRNHVKCLDKINNGTCFKKLHLNILNAIAFYVIALQILTNESNPQNISQLHLIASDFGSTDKIAQKNST